MNLLVILNLVINMRCKIPRDTYKILDYMDENQLIDMLNTKRIWERNNILTCPLAHVLNHAVHTINDKLVILVEKYFSEYSIFEQITIKCYILNFIEDYDRSLISNNNLVKAIKYRLKKYANN